MVLVPSPVEAYHCSQILNADAILMTIMDLLGSLPD
jgi:hypothetical protein